MTEETIITRLANEILYCTDISQVRDRVLYAYAAGCDEGRKQVRDNRKPVIMCDMNGKPLRRFESVSEAAMKTGFKVNSISHVLNDSTGRHKTCGGRKWIYDEG